MTISNLYPALKPSLSLDFANTKVLDPRITFARASTGAYYDGKTVAKAEENLLLRSQEFDNAYWSKFSASVTANSTTAPDGTTTADKLVEDTATTSHSARRLSVVQAGEFSLSVFASGSERFLTLTIYRTNSNFIAVTFDLNLGTITEENDTGIEAITSTSITASTNGFYRCVVSGTVLSASQVAFVLSDVNNPVASGGGAAINGFREYTGDGTSGLFLWGAQLEQRSAVTAYTPTTTQPITNYIPVLETASANVARFDHNPVTGESLGLLVEEQRTNLLTYSEDFGNAAWVKSDVTVSANQIIAPDGTLTMDKLVENTANIFHFVRQLQTTTTGTVYTLSVFAKKAERHIISLQQQNSGSQFGYVNFDLNAGVILSAGNGLTTNAGKIESIGNGVYRCSITFTATSDANRSSIFLVKNADNHVAYLGDGYSGVYIWGAQLE